MQLQKILQSDESMLNSDKEALFSLYKNIKQNRHKNKSREKKQRHLSPLQKFLISSVSSRDKLYESGISHHYNFGSPLQEECAKSEIRSPENYRILSEERYRTENVENINHSNKPKSAMS